MNNRRAIVTAISIGLLTASTVAEGSSAAATPHHRASAMADPAAPNDSSLPGPPLELRLEGRVGAATIHWSPPADGGGSPLAGYLVSASDSEARCSTTELRCDLVGLPTDGQEVLISVSAVNDAGLGQAATTTARGTRVELTVVPDDLVYGGAARASGSVAPSSGVLPTGMVVVLDEKAAWESSWRALSDVTVDASFRFQHLSTPLATEVVRARVDGGPGRLGGSATSSLITVRRGLTLSANHSRIHLGSRLTFAGRLASPHPNARIALQTYSRGRWIHVQYTRTDAASRFSTVSTVMVSGSTSWRVVAARTTALAAGVSPVVRVSVTASLNSVVGRVSRVDVQYSWRPGCPVHYTRLRSITFNYWNLGGGFERGTLIVDQGSVSHIRSAFHAAFVARFPIHSVIPIERYYKGGTRSGVAADIASMSADNTSGFNCRAVVGHPGRRSSHSWGSSIDVNPRENPYVTGGRIYPAGSAAYVNRTNRRPGMLYRSSALVVSLRNNGWTWWGGKRDFHHISRSGF